MVEVHTCLKIHLGTNSTTRLFYECLRSRPTKTYFPKFVFVREVINNCKQTVAFATTKFIITSIIQIIVYCWDLVKDLYFLAYFYHFGQVSDFGSFDSQVLVVLILSIVLPNMLNVAVLLTDDLALVPRKVKILLAFIVYLSVSVTSFVLNKIQYMRGKPQKPNVKQAASNGRVSIESKSILEECQLRSLHAKLKLTEGIFESSIQSIVLMITVAMSLRYLFQSWTRV